MKKLYANFIQKFPILDNKNTKYIIASLFFFIWMFFFDSYSIVNHFELSQEINKLEDNKEYYINEITKDKQDIKSYQNTSQIEKFAREKYYMKKENEDVFIIEFENEE